MVMFRDFAQRKAKRLGVVGTVKNLSDKSVFVVAEGDEKVLDQYVELLQKGPLLSRVDVVGVSHGAATGEFKNFTILY